MIIGYNFFALEEGAIFDTPICTDHLDELRMGAGTYDEVYVDLDTTVPDTIEKPFMWKIQTIMDAKFKGDLDSGDIGADGFKVTHIQLYRSVEGSDQWDVIGEFEYNPDFNVYNYLDKYVQNGVTYKYAVVPVANEVQGDKLYSDPVHVEYQGIFLTDRDENMKLEYDINLGDVNYNMVSATNEPLNGQYPVVVIGNTKYRSGSLSFMPLSESTVNKYGAGIDPMAEHVNRTKWIDFLSNGKAKVLRMDSGILMLVVTHGVKESHKGEEALRDLAGLNFEYAEIGKLNHENIISHNLLSKAEMSKFTFDDNGQVISGE
ncbi:hypothetical protein [Bacillus paranthracis]|uniref:hypothetical protein n=1 Tax=Bacillus paranthracis TaxID=2026186 RepID=UPI002D79DA8F|nr:hypothetical protein [Bacillus paranthracis]